MKQPRFQWRDGFVSLVWLVIFTPVVIVECADSENKNAGAYAAASYEVAPAPAEERAAAAARDLVVVTGLLGVATLGLFGATIRLVNETRHSGATQNRAYIAITTVEFNPTVAGTAYVLSPTALLLNVGKTPAIDVQVDAEFSEYPVDLTGSNIAVRHPREGASRASLLPQDTDRQIPKVAYTVTQERMQQFAASTAMIALYWVVEVIYTDVFSKAVTRHTRKCFRTVWVRSGGGETSEWRYDEANLADQFNDAS